MRRAACTVELMYTQAGELSDSERRMALAGWAVKSESESRLRAMVKLAEMEEGIAVASDVWDRDPNLLNVLNGTVDLASRGLLRSHHPQDYITKLAPTPAPDQYQAPAACPDFMRFLDRIFAGQTALIDHVQRAFGYSLTGSVEEQCMFLLHGSGANGKSTLLRVLMTMMGDYAMQGDPDLLLARRNEGHPTNVARLAGARVVVCQEVESGRRMAESLVKQLTGGDRLTARYLHKNYFEFDPTFKLWLAANHKPEIRGTDHAIWRRIRLIPFNVVIPPHEQDSELTERLLEELPGILAWALEGTRQWLTSGLGMPDVVKTATVAYREEMDALGGFFADECEFGLFTVLASALYSRYREWAHTNGELVLSQTAFGRRLAERSDLERSRHSSSGRITWSGIRLRETMALRAVG